MFFSLDVHGLLVKASQDIQGIHQGHNSIQVYRASELVIQPEERGNVSGISQSGRLKKDVVKCSASFHE